MEEDYVATFFCDFKTQTALSFELSLFNLGVKNQPFQLQIPTFYNHANSNLLISLSTNMITLSHCKPAPAFSPSCQSALAHFPGHIRLHNFKVTFQKTV